MNLLKDIIKHLTQRKIAASQLKDLDPKEPGEVTQIR